MSASDLLSSTLNWPGKGVYGLKSSVLQTTENNLVKQTIVKDHMRNHYRRLNGARSAVDSKPPKAMILGQKCRDRARKELAQLAYTQNLLDQFDGGSTRNTPRGRSIHSARGGQFVQSQPTTYRARSRSTESARMVTRSLSMNGPMQNFRSKDSTNGDIANKLFGGGVLSQALTSMAALGKMTSSERNKSSADVLDKHPESFTQPEPEEHQPRLVKSDASSSLIKKREHYNPPRKTKVHPPKPVKTNEEIPPKNENQDKQDEQLALREQLNRSLEIRHNVEKKIKKAKATTTNPPIRKQSDEVLKQYGLTEHERLQYVRFMREVTDAIIRNNLTTEPAIERLYEIHIDRNRDTLDERRLRGLLQALKEDLGVQTSRKSDTYASVSKATTFDREPLYTEATTRTREDSIVLTPKTPVSRRRQSDYDLNDPLPWESETKANKQTTVSARTTYETKRDSPPIHRDSTFNDDFASSPTIKPKPRLSLQTKTEELSAIDENLSSTVQQPKQDLFDTNWMTNEQEQPNDHQQKSPVPEASHHDANDSYGSNDFEENDDDSDH